MSGTLNIYQNQYIPHLLEHVICHIWYKNIFTSVSIISVFICKSKKKPQNLTTLSCFHYWFILVYQRLGPAPQSSGKDVCRCSIYGPISLLSCIFDCVIFKNIYNYLYSSKLLYKYQSDFVPKHSKLSTCWTSFHLWIYEKPPIQLHDILWYF